MNLKLVGVVGKKDGLLYRVVRCKDAPDHLKVMNLTPRELGKAVEGDRVELAYTADDRGGRWSVVRVLEAK